MRLDTRRLIELCDMAGVSGNEAEVSAYLQDCLKRMGADFSADSKGNIVCLRPGSRICLMAHMDEVGFELMKKIDSGKFLFRTIGYIPKESLPGTALVISSGKKKYRGQIMGSGDELYVKLLQPRGRLPLAGLNNLKRGCIASFDKTSRIKEGVLHGKAIDNRVSCAILLHLIKEYDFSFLFTVEEEIGLNGAKRYAKKLRGLSQRASQKTGYKRGQKVIVLEIQQVDGGGLDFEGEPIFIHDARGKEVKPIVDVSRLQRFNMAVGLTESDALHEAGVASNTICTPVRKAHTSEGSVSLKAIEKMILYLETVLRKEGAKMRVDRKGAGR
jgi:putative aminopeptidase FrvX